MDLLGYTPLKRLHLIDENLFNHTGASSPPWKFLCHINKNSKQMSHLRYDASFSTFDPHSFARDLRPLLEETTIHENPTGAHQAFYPGMITETRPNTHVFAPAQHVAREDSFLGVFA